MRLQFMSGLITLFDSKDDFIIGYSSQLIKQIRNYLNRLLGIIYVGTTLKNIILVNHQDFSLMATLFLFCLFVLL